MTNKYLNFKNASRKVWQFGLTIKTMEKSPNTLKIKPILTNLPRDNIFYGKFLVTKKIKVTLN